MTAKMLLLPLASAALIAAPTAGFGQSFRCRNDLVSVGDSMVAVQKACGEPVARKKSCESAPPNGDARVAPCLDVEDWTYRPGYGQFLTTLRFEDGTLVRIIYGDRQ